MTATLVEKLAGALPLPATMTPELAQTVRQQVEKAPANCTITSVHYAGDEGGIMCRFEVGEGDRPQVFFVSMTHLKFHPRAPLAREIGAYVKRRIKRLRRKGWAEQHWG